MDRQVSPAEFALQITEQVSRLATFATNAEAKSVELAEKLKIAEEKIKELSPAEEK